ncbi:MAG: exo-alpha-sialidase [Polaromonas sp.]
MHRLWVGTRKGLFVVRGGAGQWCLGEPHFAGDPVTQVLLDPLDGACYAALRLGHFGVKLHKSLDGGVSWQEITAPAFPPKPADGPWKDDATPWSVDMIWALESGPAPASRPSPTPGTLWAGCLPAGLFNSVDAGTSWQLVESLWNRPERKNWLGGGYDHAGIHSILIDPRDTRHVTVAISCGGVWQSRDAGQSWVNTSAGLQADYMPPERQRDPDIQDPHRIDHCVAAPDVLWMQHHCGLYRSTDGGLHWKAIAAPAPSGFGFCVAAHPHDPLRAWVVPAHSDVRRIPVDARLVVNESRDGGASFTSHTAGLPDHDAYHLVYRHALAVSPDGQTLAMGSTTGGLWVSEDAGQSWLCVSRDLPPIAVLRFAPQADN